MLEIWRRGRRPKRPAEIAQAKQRVMEVLCTARWPLGRYVPDTRHRVRFTHLDDPLLLSPLSRVNWPG